jgi:hypothetical protein
MGFAIGYLYASTAPIGATQNDMMRDMGPLMIALGVVIDLIGGGVLIAMIAKQRKPKVTINPVVSPVVSGYQPARFCIGCGQELHDNASFCRNCGQMIARTLNGDVHLAGQRS